MSPNKKREIRHLVPLFICETVDTEKGEAVEQLKVNTLTRLQKYWQEILSETSISVSVIANALRLRGATI